MSFFFPTFLQYFRVRNVIDTCLRRPFSKCSCRNPYDVLGLKKACSTKDVKKAYIKLCKELHPDMKPEDGSQHKKFIELNDAYITLLNLGNKRQSFDYDTDFSHMHSKTRASHTSYNSESEKPWYETEDYQQYYHQHDIKNKINLKKRKTNLWILAGCFALVVIGSSLYWTAYNYAINYRIQTIDERSKRISENYHDTKKNALKNGRIEQLDSLKRKWSI